MEYLTLIPVTSIICSFVLPVAIVLIVAITKIHRENQRSQIVIKAIEANKDVNTDRLVESLWKPTLSARERLNTRLLRGCIFSLLGVVFIIVGIYLKQLDSYGDNVIAPFVVAGMSFAVGVSYLIVYFVTRRQVDTDSNK
jgi:uncharacterized membrane protein